MRTPSRATCNVTLNRDPDVAEIQQHANEILRARSPIDFFNQFTFLRRTQESMIVVDQFFQR
jgi:hypothetical protein